MFISEVSSIVLTETSRKGVDLDCIPLEDDCDLLTQAYISTKGSA